MRPVTLNLNGIKDPQVAAALMEVQRASQDTLQSDSSSPGAAMATVPFPPDSSFGPNTFAYFSQTGANIRMAFAALTAFGRSLLALTSVSGLISLLGIRIPLSSPITFYVSNSGSDSNSGLTVGTPFLTIGHALNVASSKYDAAQQTITIQCADGTYNENITLPAIVGAGDCGSPGTPILLGNTSTPDNCIINGSGVAATVLAIGTTPQQWLVNGFKLTNVGTGPLIEADANGWVRVFNADLGSTGSASLIGSNFGATIEMESNFTISSGAATFLQTINRGSFICSGNVITIKGNLTFSSYFTYAVSNSVQEWTGTTFSIPGGSSVTGVKFYNDTGAGIKTGTGSLNAF